MKGDQGLRLLPMNAVAQKLGCDKSTVYKMIGDGRFPNGRRLPDVPGVKWLSREVDEFIERQWEQGE